MQEARNRKRLADYLADRRGELGLTQVGFSEQAGLTQKTVSRLENAEIAPRTKTLAAVDRALGWVSGSARRVLRGEEPTLLDDAGHYPSSLEDDMERYIWDAPDLTDDDRWMLIEQWRYRRDRKRAELARQQESPDQSSNTRTAQFGA